MNKNKIKETAKMAMKWVKTPTFNNIERYIQSNYHYAVIRAMIDSENTMAYIDYDKRCIVISKQADEEYATRLLAHELGHLMLEHQLRFPGDNVKKENEANYFAECLLSKPIKHKYIIAVIASVLACTLIFAGIGLITHDEPQAPPTPTETTQTQDYTQDYTGEVVVTSSGRKYHKPNCQYVRDKTNILTLTLEEAEKAEYEPCKVCFGE